MNHTGNNFIFNPDSSTVSKRSISVKEISVDTLNLNVKKPVLKIIPENPARINSNTITTTSEEKIFIPASEDSVNFNLINKSVKEQGVLQNTRTNDLLQPISSGDKQWINSGVESVIDTAQYNYFKDKEFVIKADSGVVSDTFFVVSDSIHLVRHGDSISKLRSEPEIMQALSPQKSIESVAIPAMEEKSVPSQNYSKDIITGLLIFSVAITGVIRMANQKYLRELFPAVLFSQYARKMHKTINMRNQKAAFALNMLFLFNASIFIYQFLTYYKINTLINESIMLIPLSMGLLLSFGIIKGALYLFVGFVFGYEKEIKEYLFYGVLHNKIFALIILPIILIVPYIESKMLPILFIIGFGSFILLYFMQLLRGIVIILNNLASLFYMFLYLCALEILPLIIMYNILIR